MGCCSSKRNTIKSDLTLEVMNKDMETFVVARRWKAVRFLGKGGFGRVYEVVDLLDKSQVGKSTISSVNRLKTSRTSAIADKKVRTRYAIKIEFLNVKDGETNESLFFGGYLPQEAAVLNELKNMEFTDHVPQIFDQGPIGQKWQYIVMTLLGPSVTNLMKLLGKQHFSPQTVAVMTKQMLVPLRSLHSIGFLHRDIKPSNFVVGLHPNKHTIYLIDYGVVRKFVDENFMILPPRCKAPLRGTFRYMSLAALTFKEQSPKDDLWSLFYSWAYLRTGTLPWMNCTRLLEARKIKLDIDAHKWLKDVEPQYLAIFDCLTSLSYRVFPPYPYLNRLCDDLMKFLKVKPKTPLDWEPGGPYFDSYQKDRLNKLFDE